MAMIDVVRSLGDELRLGVTRLDEASAALRGLAGDAAAAEELTQVVRGGAGADDGFEVVRDLAQSGNRGLWDAWTKADAADSILTRALARHPGGAGQVELLRAQVLAEQASGDLGNWIARGGRDGTVEQLDAMVRPGLDAARDAAARVLDSLPGAPARSPLAGARRLPGYR